MVMQLLIKLAHYKLKNRDWEIRIYDGNVDKCIELWCNGCDWLLWLNGCLFDY